MPKQAMPVKTITVDFTEDGYPGFESEVWVNATARTLRPLFESKDPEELTSLFLKHFPKWNFRDFDGKPIPHSADALDDIPPDLVRAMWRRRLEALREAALPANLNGHSLKEEVKAPA